MKKIAIIVVVLAVFAGGAYLIWGRGNAGEKSGDEAKPGSPVAGALPGAAPALTGQSTGVIKSGALPESIAEIAQYQYTETYLNADYGFSFKYPKDFAVSEIAGDASEVVLVQNIAKNIGIQILITPNDESDSDITAEAIHEKIPDLKISEPQEVLVGENRKGLAFKSDNEAFGGTSREVWFIFNGNVYQISAYAEFDELLKGLFGTWEFMKK
ncbi:MAG: hypothetical protein UU95_C0040G0001 [Parcubacteria group bacterium GW2011_GWC2_42_12]|nr:MAG: hypothetical protein UU95_C0040G0001 [Parcubacteria group bacterium GW2011_GWC2_42_12]